MSEPANTNDSKTPAPPKKVVVKGPKWPGLTFTDALAKAKTIYNHEKRNATTAEVMLGHLGVKAGTGRANRILASLRAYGLVQRQTGGNYVISDKAWRMIVVLQDDSPERQQLIREAALSPSLFKEILAAYPDELPSDATLRQYLLLNKGFNENSVSPFLEIFKAALAIAKTGSSDYTPDDLGDENTEDEEDDQMHQQPSTPARPKEPTFGAGISPIEPRKLTDFRRLTELSFKLSRDSDAKITIYGEASQEAIKKLRALLELSEDTFPTKAEIERPKARLATWRNKDHDQPVTITGDLGEKDGKRYFAAKETDTGIPEDELEFEDVARNG